MISRAELIHFIKMGVEEIEPIIWFFYISYIVYFIKFQELYQMTKFAPPFTDVNSP